MYVEGWKLDVNRGKYPEFDGALMFLWNLV